MPHNSAQQQQQQQRLPSMNPYGSVPPSPMSRNMNMPPQGFPGRNGAMEFRPGMIPPHPMHMQHQQQQQQHQQHQQEHMMRMGGPPPGGAMNSSWMQPAGPGRIHRVPAHSTDDGNSVASKPGSMQQYQQHEREVTPQSLPEKEPSSFDSQHDVARSVLLLAAGSPRKVKSTDDYDYDDDDEESTTERVPLKKRKKMTGILRHQVTQAAAPCSVSPMSHGSKALSSGESTTRTPSYDLKDGIVLPDSAKISNTKDIDIAPPAHVVIPHFPSVLHSLLTESEFAGTVVQWLPHGQAWKIVRWDTLRRQALPKYFPQLVEENGGKNPSGSIDAFLWHISAWGFEEVTHGPDMGAYANVLFRRDIPTLCREMHFAPALEKDDDDTIDSPVAPKNSGGGGGAAHSILQVPSLGSVGGGTESHGGRLPEGRSQQPGGPALEYRSVPGFGGRPNHMNWMQDGRQPHHHQQYHHQQQHHQQYHQNHHQQQHQQHQQQHHQQQQQQHQQQQQQEAAFRMANQGGAPIMRQHPNTTHGNMPVPSTAYSPVGIRSGRGAARLPAPRRSEAAPSAVSAPSTTASALASASAPVPTSRPSYPVSNRGKGNRHSASRRSSLETNATVSGAVAHAFTETAVGAVTNTSANANASAVGVGTGVKQVVPVVQQFQPPSILKRKFSSVVDSRKPVAPVPAMEEKKDNDDSGIVRV